MEFRYDALRAKEKGQPEGKKKPEWDTEPDMMELEKKRERGAFLNRQAGLFADRADGLNRTKSVFERTALFHADGD